VVSEPVGLLGDGLILGGVLRRIVVVLGGGIEPARLRRGILSWYVRGYF
jgi:hypothetical protein